MSEKLWYTSGVQSVAFSRMARPAVVMPESELWDVSTGQCLALQEYTGGVQSVAF